MIMLVKQGISLLVRSDKGLLVGGVSGRYEIVIQEIWIKEIWDNFSEVLMICLRLVSMNLKEYYLVYLGVLFWIYLVIWVQKYVVGMFLDLIQDKGMKRVRDLMVRVKELLYDR